MEHQEQDSARHHAELSRSGVKSKPINVAMMQERLRIDEDSGRLVWNDRRVIIPHHKTWNKKYPGKFADSRLDKSGYRMVMVDGEYFKAHRVAWAIHNGKDPQGYDIDHINMDKADNRPENLRIATSSQNKMNTTVRRDNTSGVKGVSWFSRENKWVAQIWIDRNKIVIGYFDNIEDAANAYAKKSKEIHREFGRLV